MLLRPDKRPLVCSVTAALTCFKVSVSNSLQMVAFFAEENPY